MVKNAKLQKQIFLKQQPRKNIYIKTPTDAQIKALLTAALNN